MSILVDTNVLLRRSQPNHELYNIAVGSIAKLISNGETPYFTPQIMGEFWNVATRPQTYNGLGYSISMVAIEIEKIETHLTLLPDIPAVYIEWKRLVLKHSVKGIQVHDTRLVASMNVHGVKRILTFNGADFTRYDIEILHPSSV